MEQTYTGYVNDRGFVTIYNGEGRTLGPVECSGKKVDMYFSNKRLASLPKKHRYVTQKEKEHYLTPSGALCRNGHVWQESHVNRFSELLTYCVPSGTVLVPAPEDGYRLVTSGEKMDRIPAWSTKEWEPSNAQWVQGSSGNIFEKRKFYEVPKDVHLWERGEDAKAIREAHNKNTQKSKSKGFSVSDKQSGTATVAVKDDPVPTTPSSDKAVEVKKSSDGWVVNISITLPSELVKILQEK